MGACIYKHNRIDRKLNKLFIELLCFQPFQNTLDMISNYPVLLTKELQFKVSIFYSKSRLKCIRIRDTGSYKLLRDHLIFGKTVIDSYRNTAKHYDCYKIIFKELIDMTNKISVATIPSPPPYSKD
jgi:hypothetical protein